MAIDRKTFFKVIGAKIAYYRGLRGLTQDELSRCSNISVSVIRKIEQGRYNGDVALSKVLDIADALQLNVYLLLDFNEEERKLVER